MQASNLNSTNRTYSPDYHEGILETIIEQTHRMDKASDYMQWNPGNVHYEGAYAQTYGRLMELKRMLRSYEAHHMAGMETIELTYKGRTYYSEDEYL